MVLSAVGMKSPHDGVGSIGLVMVIVRRDGGGCP